MSRAMAAYSSGLQAFPVDLAVHRGQGRGRAGVGNTHPGPGLGPELSEGLLRQPKLVRGRDAGIVHDIQDRQDPADPLRRAHLHLVECLKALAAVSGAAAVQKGDIFVVGVDGDPPQFEGVGHGAVLRLARADWALPGPRAPSIAQDGGAASMGRSQGPRPGVLLLLPRWEPGAVTPQTLPQAVGHVQIRRHSCISLPMPRFRDPRMILGLAQSAAVDAVAAQARATLERVCAGLQS